MCWASPQLTRSLPASLPWSHLMSGQNAETEPPTGEWGLALTEGLTLFNSCPGSQTVTPGGSPLTPGPGPCCSLNHLALTKPDVRHVGKASGNPKPSSLDEETLPGWWERGIHPTSKVPGGKPDGTVCHEQGKSSFI